VPPKFLVGLAFCACLFGCDQAAQMKKFIPQGAESSARGYFDLLQQGKIDQIARDFGPSVPNLRDELAQTVTRLPDGPPESVKVVGANTLRTENDSTTTITLEYQFPKKWLLVSVTTKKAGDASTLEGLWVYSMADSLENLNRFTLVGKSPSQYLILILAASSLVFSFYVLVLCIRTKDVKRKWLWLLFILVGVGNVAINWKTGELTFRIFSIQLLTAAINRPLYGPWTIAAFLPLGAILFLNRQRNVKIAAESIPRPAPGTE
jgi:hypothetical protein